MATFKFRNLKSGHAIAIPSGEFTVGRAEDSYVQVDDSSVSRRHARLINDEQGFFLEDLGSANGVALQGAYVHGRAKIKLGDLVHIGKMPFRIDPQVFGESSTVPPIPAQAVDDAAMRRETERLAPSAVTDSSTPAAISFTPAMAVPEPKREKPERSKSGNLVRKSVPLPTLVRLMEPPVVLVAPSEPASAAPIVVETTVLPGSSTGVTPPTNSEAMPWWWWTVVFLAGLGSGLLLGLYFAKLFLDLGGRPSSLP